MKADLICPKTVRGFYKAISYLIILWCLMVAGNVHATDKEDTICVYFKVNSFAIDALFDENKAQLIRLDSLLNNVGIDSIRIISSVSPDGKLSFNEQLAKKRRDILLDYIKARLTIASKAEVTSSLHHITWDNVLRRVKQDSLFPQRLAVIKILEDSNTDTFQKQQRLKRLSKGLPYRDMADRWLPLERFTQCVISLRKNELPVIDTVEQEKDVCLPLQTISPAILTKEKISRWRITTNLIYWAALAHNGGMEYVLSDQQTLSLNGGCAWWSKLSNQRVYRWLAGELAFHHYFQRNYCHSGFFVGTYVQTGEFELMFGSKNRKGEFTAAGISSGYRWILGNRLSLHAELGVGYMYIDYRYAIDITGTLVSQGHNYTHYVGPTRLSLSLVYNFKNKNR
ncbi:MAG: DUF3575 domain-containing protein [Prevotella sp.]|nr:DUF3575 domain-containing protein [Prevotella sp.]